MALYLRGIASVGEGLTGRGMEHPPPLSHASPIERFSLEHPHLPAAPRPPPAPFRGGGQCMAIGSVAVSGGRRQDSSESSRLKPAEGDLSRGAVSTDNRPRGGGADGEGDGTSPAPVAARQRERFHRERYSLTTPAAPVACVSLKSSLAGSPPPPGLLPPPPTASRGGGQ